MVRMNFSLLCLTFIVCVVATDNGKNEAANAKQVINDKVKKASVKISTPQRKAEQDENGTEDLDVQASFNYTAEGDEDGNGSVVDVPPKKTLTVAHWTIVECGSNEFTWVCEMERHLLIPEIGFWDTLKFVVGGEKLKIAASEDGPPDSQSSSLSPTRSPTPPAAPPSTPFIIHLRILVQCPPRCHYDECSTSASNMYLHSFWLGLLVGVIIGIVTVALLTTCASAAVSKTDEKKMPC